MEFFGKNLDFEDFKVIFKTITNYDIIIINNSPIISELTPSKKLGIVVNIFTRYLALTNKKDSEESNPLNIILFKTQEFIENTDFNYNIEMEIYYRNNSIILQINDLSKKPFVSVDKKYYNRFGDIVSLISYSTEYCFKNPISGNLYNDTGKCFNLKTLIRMYDEDLIEEFKEEIVVESKITNNIISISSNLKQKFLRKDGKIAGPFDENKSTVPFTYFDNKYHELYNNNGLLYSRGISFTEPTAEEDLVSAVKSKGKRKPIYNDMIRLEKFDFSDVDEENLCQCSDCKFSRSLLKDNIKSDLIQKLELARELILKYDDTIPKFPDFFYVGVSLQQEILNILLNKIEEYEGIDGVLKIIPEYKENIKKDKVIENSNSLEDKEIILSKIINIQQKLLIDKKILLNISVKKLLKNSVKELTIIYETFNHLYDTTNKFKKIRKVNLQPIKMNLTKREINDNSIVSNSIGIENEEGMLNPAYNYVYVIKNGIISGIYPINKNK